MHPTDAHPRHGNAVGGLTSWATLARPRPNAGRKAIEKLLREYQRLLAMDHPIAHDWHAHDQHRGEAGHTTVIASESRARIERELNHFRERHRSLARVHRAIEGYY